MPSWKKIIVSGSNAELNQVTGSYFKGDGSALTGITATSVNIDGLGAGTTLHQTEDYFMFSDDGTEKKITFSDFEDVIFGNVSSDATIAAGGALTIADNAVTLAKMAGLARGKIIIGDASGDPSALAAGADGKILVADGNGDITWTTVSGDVSLSAGAVTIAANAVEGSMLNSNVAGSGLDYGSNELTVDVSDFMANGADNRVLTATGTDAFTAESGLTFDGSELRVQGDVVAENYIVSSSVTYMTSSFSSGSTIFGDTIDDTHKFTGSLYISGSVFPGIDDKFDLGASGTQWKDLYIDGTAYIDSAQIDSLGAALDANNQNISNIDVDSGTIDGTTIGASSATTIVGTTIDASTDFTIGDTIITDGVITDSTGLQLAANLDINGTTDISGDLTLSAGADGALRFSAASSIKILDNSSTALVIEEADNAYLTFDTTDSSEQVIFNKNSTFNGTTIANLGTVSAATSITATDLIGTNIDGIIGADTARAGSFTTLSATGNVDLGDATGDTITATGRFDSDLVPSADSAQDLGTTALYWKAAYIDAITTTGNVTIGGNLNVNGTTSTLSVTNLEIGDAFGFFATGSAGTNVDAGIIVQSGSFVDSGSAIYHDVSDERWAVAKGIASDATAVTPLEYVVTVKALGDNDDAVAGDKEYGVGEMAINSDGTIWIYS